MILDATCGMKSMYKGLHQAFDESEIIFLDKREGDFSFTAKLHPDRNRWGARHNVVINPSIQADLRCLPFRSSIFNLVLFDPPHVTGSPKFQLGRAYGNMSLREYARVLVKANEEFDRVLSRGGLVLVKTVSSEKRDWHTEVGLKNFKLLLDVDVLSKARSKTVVHWMLFVKR